MLFNKAILCSALLGLAACGSQADLQPESSDLKIYGGAKVNKSDAVAKFTVVLLQNNSPVCTGTLISERLVLTAAHCAALIKPNRPAYVGFGLKAKTTEKVAIKGFIAHKAFDAAAGMAGGTDVVVNDIGLIKLAADAPADYKPVELSLESDDLELGETVVLAGFGRTNSGGWFGGGVGELYQVETKLVLEAPKAKEVWFGDSPGKSACSGDSGGPALIQRQQGFKLLGVTSRGRDCKSDVIYTDVRYFQNWIVQTAASIED